MNTYTIANKTSGFVLGTYEGENELEAYRASLRDAGYTESEYDGEEIVIDYDRIPADIAVTEVK